MRELLAKLIAHENLSEAEVRTAFIALTDGRVNDVEIAGILVGLASKGVTATELTAAAGVMRERAILIPKPPGMAVLDTCSTGGSIPRRCGKAMFNISTAAALLASACGVKVVKHGNRSASSRSGSADVLESLGVRLDLSPDEASRCLADVGICFAFARNHHPAAKHVASVRAALGVPTIFNLLAPLMNPAGANFQLLGVYRKDIAELIAETLAASGTEHAWVVHSDDGFDELSTAAPSYVAEVKDGRVTTWTFDPAPFGLLPATPENLQVDDVADSAAAIRAILAGERGPKRDIAALNAAAGLLIAGVVGDLAEGLTRVDAAIASGTARRTLDRLIAFA